MLSQRSMRRTPRRPQPWPNRLTCVAALALAGFGCAARSDRWMGAGQPEVVATAPTIDLTAVTALVRTGDEHWRARNDEVHLRRALNAWGQAAAYSPDDAELLVKLTRGHYFLADAYLRANEDAYLAELDQAVQWGQRALNAVSPEFEKRMAAGMPFQEAVAFIPKAGVPAMYWYASALGRWAQHRGFGGVMGNKDDVKAAMDRCLHLQPDYYFGGPHRYFGAYYAVAPTLAGGDAEKSKVHFQRSLAIAPDFLGTKVLWAAELAVKERDEETFEKLLNEVLASSPEILADVEPEGRVEQAKARELLAHKDDLF